MRSRPRPSSRGVAHVLFSALFLLPLAGALGAQSTPVPESSLTPPDPAFEKELAYIQKLTQSQIKFRFAKAARELPRLRALAGDRCGLCLLELAQVERRSGDREKAIATTRAALDLHGPRDFTAAASNQLGALLIAPDASEDRLREAERYLRQGIDLGDAQAISNLASLRLRREAPAEAVELARRYLAVAPAGSMAREARLVLCDARAALPEGVAGSVLTAAEPIESSRATVRPVVLRSEWGPPSLDVYHRLAVYHRMPDAWHGDAGVAKIDAVIDEEGCVLAARAPGQDPEAEQSAVLGAVRWVFQPAMVQGRPVPVKATLYFDFGHSFDRRLDPLLSCSVPPVD